VACVACCPGAHAPVGPERVVSRTALALLAFFSRGYTHRFGSHRRAVRKGLKWLRARADEGGDLAPGLGPVDRLREQALGTLALVEAYAISREAWLERSAERSLVSLVEQDLPSLSFAPPRVAGWALAALDGAQLAKLQAPTGAWEQAARHFPPAPSGDLGRDALTLWVHLRAGAQGHPALADAVWAAVAGGELAAADLDTWHLVSRALSREGGELWGRYRKPAEAALLALEGREGCRTGTWDPWLRSALGSHDRLVATCLFSAMLELEYRWQRARGG
jgi:hypothetical protein